MSKIVIDLMDYAGHPALKDNVISLVNEHHGGFDVWVSVGPIADDAEGFNTLNEIAARHVQVGDLVVVLFEVPFVYDRAFDTFVFRAFHDWGPITVYTEPTTVI